MRTTNTATCSCGGFSDAGRTYSEVAASLARHFSTLLASSDASRLALLPRHIGRITTVHAQEVGLGEQIPDSRTDDDTAAGFFQSGWDAAIREVALQNSHGRLDEFLREQTRVTTTEDTTWTPSGQVGADVLATLPGWVQEDYRIAVAQDPGVTDAQVVVAACLTCNRRFLDPGSSTALAAMRRHRYEHSPLVHAERVTVTPVDENGKPTGESRPLDFSDATISPDPAPGGLSLGFGVPEYGCEPMIFSVDDPASVTYTDPETSIFLRDRYVWVVWTEEGVDQPDQVCVDSAEEAVRYASRHGWKCYTIEQVVREGGQ